MKHVIRGVGFGMVAALSCASAGAYQVEATGAYFDFDDANDSALGVMAEYHFAPVDDNGVPRAEAGFLRRSSNIGAFYSTFDEADVDIIGFGGEFYIQDFYASAGLTRTDFAGAESDDLLVEVGLLPMDGVLLSVSYVDEDLANLSTISLNGKMVRPLSGESAVNVEASVGQTDDVDDTISYMLRGDFYVNNDLSLGLSYADTDADASEEDIGLHARMFVIPTLSLQIDYQMQEFNDRFVLGVTGRF